MHPARSNVSRCRALVAAKLGRCPRCLRLSVQGATVAWVCFGVTRALITDPAAWLAPLLLGIAFTLLLAAHVVAFMARVAHAARDVERLPSAPGPTALGRRRFVRLVLVAGASFVLAGVLGAVGAHAQGSLQECATCLAGDCKKIAECPKGESCVKNLNKKFCQGAADGTTCGNCQTEKNKDKQKEKDKERE